MQIYSFFLTKANLFAKLFMILSTNEIDVIFIDVKIWNSQEFYISLHIENGTHSNGAHVCTRHQHKRLGK